MALWHRGVCVCVQCRDSAADLCHSASSAALFQGLLTDKKVTSGSAEWCVLQRIKKKKKRGGPEQLLKFAHERDTEATTHKSCRTASQARHGNESKNTKKKRGESDLFFMNNSTCESKQEMWHFCLKRSRVSAASCLRLGASDKTPLPCYHTLGVSSAKGKLDPPKDFHFTHCSQGGWAKYPSASKSIKLVFGCHLILHQCFSVFQNPQMQDLPLVETHSISDT